MPARQVCFEKNIVWTVLLVEMKQSDFELNKIGDACRLRA